MNTSEAIQALEAAGSEQTRKTYRRHGVTGPVYGVSYAVLGKLTKQIKSDHALAVELWATGNHDARILATMIADPSQLTEKLLESWAKDLENRVTREAFARLAAKSPSARKLGEKWAKVKAEQIGAAGWVVLGTLAMNDEELPDAYFESHLETIERDIHSRPNWVRYSMNMALIAIGVRNAKLKEKALAASARIGKVEVDHGDTDCKTPNAAEYIKKAIARKGF